MSDLMVGNGEQRGSAKTVLGRAAVLRTVHSSGPSGTAVSSAKKLEQNGKVGSYLYSLLPLGSICSKDLLKWESLPHLCCNKKLLSFIIISFLIQYKTSILSLWIHKTAYPSSSNAVNLTTQKYESGKGDQ